jgi:hypothetical protein
MLGTSWRRTCWRNRLEDHHFLDLATTSYKRLANLDRHPLTLYAIEAEIHSNK